MSNSDPQGPGSRATLVNQLRRSWVRLSEEHGFIFVLAIFFLIFFCLTQLANTHNQLAVNRIQQTATDGDINAQRELAVLYYKGIGVGVDYVTAAHAMEKAARAGHPGAQAHMGALHYAGLGVLQVDRAALCWYVRSAAQGDPIGALGLATMYLTGRGVEKSLGKAYAWINVGNSKGNPTTREVRERLRAALGTKEVRKTQALSKLFLNYEERIAELATTGCNAMRDLQPQTLWHRN